MSAFDDEFGLFEDEAAAEDDEHRSTLGARAVSSGETIIDEIEMDDDERPRRGRPPMRRPDGSPEVPRHRRPMRDERRASPAPDVLKERAVNLLTFLAKGLVSKPETVGVSAHDDPRQGMVLELEVAADDLGKVIGRGGRVAQALRTVVRAGAEGRVAIEIIDIEDDETEEIALTVSDTTERALNVDAAGDDAPSAGEVLDAAIESADAAAESAPEAAVEAAPEAEKRKPRPRRRRPKAAVTATPAEEAEESGEGE